MKKVIIILTVLFSAISLKSYAQKELGYFNSIAIGANIGTTGWGIDLATPIGKHFALRAGINFMPNFSMTDEVDINY